MDRPVEQRKWSFVPGTFVLIVAASLLIGYAAGTRNDQIISAVAPVLGVKVETSTLDFSSVQTTFRQLKLNYDGELNEQDLINGASRGLVGAVDDNYTVYFDKKEAEAFNKDLTGDIGGGIGAEIGSRNYRPTVLRILQDTPASESDLRAGDSIIAVNDEATTEWSISDTVNKIRGEIGTTVKLTVQRGTAIKNISIKREQIIAPSVESEIIDGVGVVTLRRFDETTYDDLKKAANNFVNQRVKGVVLDLRGNGGGLLSSARDVAGVWLNNKVIVSERSKGVVIEELKSGYSPILDGVKTVVLINGSSASASEIVAGALQDYGTATLVGEATFGKGSVQKLVDLPNNAVLKVTVAKWYTPKGKNINEDGIRPDVKVELTAEDGNANRDPQLDRAIGLIK